MKIKPCPRAAIANILSIVKSEDQGVRVAMAERRPQSLGERAALLKLIADEAAAIQQMADKLVSLYARFTIEAIEHITVLRTEEFEGTKSFQQASRELAAQMTELDDKENELFERVSALAAYMATLRSRSFRQPTS